MAYAYKRSCTCDHTQAGSSDSSNFPVLVSVTDTTLKTVAHGGHIQNTVTVNGYVFPADLAFFSGSGLTGLLNFEIEFYDGTNGILVAWVQVATVSHTADTVFYMGYDDVAVTTFQGNVNNTWDSNFVGIYHFRDGTTLDLTDSTNQTNDGINTSALPDTGQIDGGVFVNPTPRYFQIARSSSLNTMVDGDHTFSIWVKNNDSTFARFLEIRDTTSGYHIVLFNYTAAGHVHFYAGSGSDVDALDSVASNLNNNTFRLLHFVLSGSTQSIYVDGALDGSRTQVTGTAGSDSNFIIGIGLGLANSLTATLDELRLSKSARSADWILTEYNNQKTSSTFLAIGNETSTAITFMPHPPFMIPQAIRRSYDS
jgi:hypothetical protein